MAEAASPAAAQTTAGPTAQTAAKPAAGAGAGPRTVEEPGMGRLEVWDLPTDEATLMALFEDVFGGWWRSIHFGILIQGAAWEIRAPAAPRKIALFDGYVTVDFGAWHFHICIGETGGSPGHPTPPDLARRRRTARAELYRELQEQGGAPNTWGLRLLNGAGEQQITVFLPSPFLSDGMQPLDPPDFTRLAMWDHLRRRYLGLEADPLDRTGRGFIHG